MSDFCEEYCIVHRHEIRKARKEHECCACGAVIRPGDYYACVFSLGQEGAEAYKRCGSCEKTWRHLDAKCREHNRIHNDSLFPFEDLSCGKAYEEEWGELPDEIEALPFLSAEERGQLLKPAEAAQ